jgi:glutamyl-Q tRNA(Asp) synthetase
MEDLDAPRTMPGASDEILRQLDSFGLEWDGPVVYQSARIEAYRKAFEDLRIRGAVYPCFCSRREIEDSAARAGARSNSRYPGTCRERPPVPDRKPAWRIRTHDEPIRFRDGVQGIREQRVESECGDFVLLRADGVFAYQLAVVVDDAAQGVTAIVRGADLLDSTFRQILLQQALGLPQLEYLHLPVATNANGEKLSKQTLAVPLNAADPTPELWRALRFLGQCPPRELARGSPGLLWQWARKNWDAGRIRPEGSLF